MPTWMLLCVLYVWNSCKGYKVVIYMQITKFLVIHQKSKKKTLLQLHWFCDNIKSFKIRSNVWVQLNIWKQEKWKGKRLWGRLESQQDIPSWPLFCTAGFLFGGGVVQLCGFTCVCLFSHGGAEWRKKKSDPFGI